jgi:hypothetical protein
VFRQEDHSTLNWYINKKNYDKLLGLQVPGCERKLRGNVAGGRWWLINVARLLELGTIGGPWMD